MHYFEGDLLRRKYKAFVEESVDTELDYFYKAHKVLPVLGCEMFIKSVSDKYLQEKHKINDISEHKLLYISTRNNINEIMDAVSIYYGASKNTLMFVNKNTGNLVRSVEMYLSLTIG